MPKPLKTAILCGGFSSEHEVSLNSAKNVLKYIDRKKYRPVLVVIGKDGKWRFGSEKSVDIEGALAKLKGYDFAFIAMHGVFGEDGRIQMLLEWIGIPYSGSGGLSSAMAMDKGISNELYRASGMRVPRYMVLKKKGRINFHLPAVIKPVDGGSSIGVSIAKSKVAFQASLKKILKENGLAMVQEFVKGREFTCGVIERNGRAFALPPTEIIAPASKFYAYKAKYKDGGSIHICPARLPLRLSKEVQKMALEAHTLLHCRGMSRSDFILSGSRFYILETNTIPGMTVTSLLPQAAEVAGISFKEMLDLIIVAGLKKD